MTGQQALETLFQSMEESSASGTRDKGTRFETLVRDWLTKEPTYRDLFTSVLTYKEWAKQNPQQAGDARDIGVDLVGVNADDDKFTAIQCKFYGKDATVPKAGVDSFIAASNKPFFSRRFLVATNEKWTGNVRKELKELQPPVTLITREDFVHSTVDWEAYLKGELKEVKKRTPRPYQNEAIESVLSGFKEADRGKLIMACGTGKTYTSLKIAEKQAGPGKLVLFLVPSLALLSQTLSDWKQQCAYPIKAFAVCSDRSIGKGDLEDTASLTVGSELAYPATTNAPNLAKEVEQALKNKKAMTVVFSTYQSLDVIHDAQNLKSSKLPEFDLVICDEAHRTAGGHFTDEEESLFTRIHDNEYVAAKKRLYMTATPKIFGQDTKKQEDDGDIVLYSMDDENIFGKTFHSINFTEAVRLGSLVDYKVIVLSVADTLVKDDRKTESDQQKDKETEETERKLSDPLVYGSSGGLSASNAAKVVGCWRALSKRDLQAEVSMGDDLQPMKRAVGFAQVIEPSEKYDRVSSKAFTAAFQGTIEEYKEKIKEEFQKKGAAPDESFEELNGLYCETRHIDGSMDATEKANRLEWLRAPVEENHCKILFNVRCLSEGVDVPSLDAVLFLSPRKSMVDVVQTVGRVMRTSKETKKERGYVIIPIVTPAGVPADTVLDNNKDFQTVWQVLRALKSIDEDFGSMVDGQLKTINPEKMEVICISDKKFTKNTKSQNGAGTSGGVTGKRTPKGSKPEQLELSFARDEILEDKIRSRIVKKVGNRKEWADWAADVGIICKKQMEHIQAVLSNEKNVEVKEKFEAFTLEMRETLNNNLGEEEIIEMLGQHIVTKPVVDALFGNTALTEKNPISKAMTGMLESLDKEGMMSATKLLEGFYNSVRVRAKNIKTPADRQTVIIELFDKFFKFAFPKMRDKLGIVYTPVEIVDFINSSVSYLLGKEFKQNIAAKDVQILDPFAGTGTFICRLLQSGLIPKDKLMDKYRNGLHAQEIVPLAYYISCMNMEAIMHQEFPDTEYEPNDVMILTDTFASREEKTDLFITPLAENNKRLKKLNEEKIEVIIGNPPYSAGQDSQNDDNENEHYESLDKRLAETYVKESSAGLKNSLYDSYIRAYRWASDRIGQKGIIGFITNAGWIDSSSGNGMRKCIAKEFNSIYIFHLKGNQRTSGELSRKEGGKIFGEGSRAPIAIVILVKNLDDKEKGKIFFHEIGDYLSREEKLLEVQQYGSIERVNWTRLFPDKHGDWLNQREESFNEFRSIGSLKNPDEGIFSVVAWGVKSNRDVWTVNSSKKVLSENIILTQKSYSSALKRVQRGEDLNIVRNSTNNFSWSAGTLNALEKKKDLPIFSQEKIRKEVYRPFFSQELYYERSGGLIERPGKWAEILPKPEYENLIICVTGIGAKEFSCLMTDKISDIQFLFNSQCFPFYIYEKQKVTPNTAKEPELFDLTSGKRENSIGDNYLQKEVINDNALEYFKKVFPDKVISKKDLFFYVYGLLHSQDYRKKYANNLVKELPRIPRVSTFEQFTAFREAGEKLADLHVRFDEQPAYDKVKVDMKPGASFRVEQMRWGKIPGKTGNAAKDKTRLIYNKDITIENIPLEAQEYVVNKKSALDWVVERCCVTTDKASGIVNDFNKYGEEQGLDKYPYDLFLKVITVSLETVKIVKSLPPLDIHPLDKA